MIRYILNSRSPLFWVVFHIALGIVSTLTPWVLIAWFYFVLLTTWVSLFRRTGGTFVPLVFLVAYATSFELLARMSGTSPFVPYELGKYLLLVLLVFGMLKGYRRGYIGWLMIVLLLPGALIDLAGETTFKNIVFNLIGPINVALAVVFFSRQEIEKDAFIDTIRLMFYPLVSVLAFVILKTPNLETVEFKLGANFETSGGFGTNQVSTALGLGAFFVFLFWRKNWQLTGYRWLDLAMLLLFIFRGLVTFSRGGMIGGALGILLLLILDRGKSSADGASKPGRSVVTAIPILLLLLFTFIYADKITGGLLIQRYQGETPGTLAGRKEKTLNVITSNRLQIFSDDLKLWKENPVFGVGVGASMHLREKSKGFHSHIEISRLLSEHGVLGLVYSMILLGLGYRIYKKHKLDFFRVLMVALYTIALFTTFHSAMRTYLSPLLFGLSMILVNKTNIKNNDE